MSVKLLSISPLTLLSGRHVHPGGRLSKRERICFFVSMLVMVTLPVTFRSDCSLKSKWKLSPTGASCLSEDNSTVSSELARVDTKNSMNIVLNIFILKH